MVSSGSSFISLLLVAKSCEFLMWCGVFPTNGAKIVARCLAMLYVTELMLLMIGLSGAPSLCILGSPQIRGIASQGYRRKYSCLSIA